MQKDQETPAFNELTDRQKSNVRNCFISLKDRVERASVANHEVAFDMLEKVITEAKYIKRILAKTKRWK